MFHGIGPSSLAQEMFYYSLDSVEQAGFKIFSVPRQCYKTFFGGNLENLYLNLKWNNNNRTFKKIKTVYEYTFAKK